MDLESGVDVRAVVELYADEIARCRYGTFRGVIKDGQVVIFAVEHEWRPKLEARRRLSGVEEDEQAVS